MLNPAGFLFGPNASIFVTGSFFASSATRLRLDDGSVYDFGASTAPLLSTAAPEHFGFLNPTGSIDVRGSQLQVQEGTLGLIGTELNLDADAYVTTNYIPGLSVVPSLSVLLQATKSIRSDAGFVTQGGIRMDAPSIEIQGGDLDSPGPFGAGTADDFALGGIELRGGRVALRDAYLDSPRITISGGDLTLERSALESFSGTPRNGAISAIRLTGNRISLTDSSFFTTGSVTLDAVAELSIQRGGRGALPTQAESLTLNGADIHLADLDVVATSLLVTGQRLLLDNGARLTTFEGARRDGLGGSFSLTDNPSYTFRLSDQIILRDGGIFAPTGGAGTRPPMVNLFTSRLFVEGAGIVSAGS